MPDGEKRKVSKSTAISREESWEIIDNQIETHHHIQSQARGTIRFLAAVIAVGATIAISDFTVSFQPSPGGISEAAEQFSTTEPDVRGTLTHWEPIFLRLLLVLLTLSWLYSFLLLLSLMRSSQLSPRLGDDTSKTFIITSGPLNTYSTKDLNDWISKNEQILSDEHRKLTVAVTHLLMVLLIGIYTLLQSNNISNSNLSLVLYMNTLPFLPLIFLLVIPIGGFGRMIFAKSQQNESGNTLRGLVRMIDGIIYYLPGNRLAFILYFIIYLSVLIPLGYIYSHYLPIIFI